MAQADYTIADQAGLGFLAEVNDHMAAIVSNNSGATEPDTKYAYQWWADTTTGLLKQRNATNNAWITIGTMASANLGLAALGVTAGTAVQVDQAVTATTRSATTTLGTTLNHTLSDSSTTITAFNGVAGVTYKCRALGAGDITHHATNLIITQGLASITTAAGMTFDVEMITSTTCRIKNIAMPADLPATRATNAFTGAQIGGVTALTSSSASIAIDLAVNNNFSHTTSENTTLAEPSNPVAGQSGIITITQGGTARTLAYNTFYKFAGGTIPALTATIGAVDVLAYYVESATRATCQLIKDSK